jgi:hypothetical protein
MLPSLAALSLCLPAATPQGTAGPTPPRRAQQQQETAGPRGPQSVLEVIPLQHVCGWRTSLVPPQWGSMLQFADADDRPDLLNVRADGRHVDIDSAAELLSNLHMAAIEANRLHIDRQNDDLFVLGDGAEVALVRDEVQALSALLLRPMQIEVALWDAGGAVPPAVSTPEGWAQFVANREPAWRSVAETQSARSVALDRQRWTRYVRDINVEVASKLAISHPVVDAFGEGGRVVVTPHALVGGDDIVLHVQFGLSQRRGQVRTAPTGVPGHADLELPLLETTYGACSGRVTNGGALAVTLRGEASGGGQSLLTIRVTSRTPPPTATVSGLSVLPCSALTSEALSMRLSPPTPYPTDFEANTQTEEIGAGFGFIEGDRLEELLRTSLGADAEDCQMHLSGGHLFVLATDALRARVEAVLRGLQERMLRTVTVRHRGRFAGAADDAASLHDIVLPTLLGREATVCRVLETNAIHALWVEVAQEASILDPHVEAQQSGCWLQVRVAPEGPGMHLHLLAQVSHAPLPLSRSVVPAGGNLMPSDVTSIRTYHDGPAANDQVLDHGDGPSVLLDGRPMRSTLETRVRW